MVRAVRAALAEEHAPHNAMEDPGEIDRRLKQFGRFGGGEPVGHWGGRLIWQLADSDALRVAWHTITWSEDARAYEKRLLAHFAASHRGKRPFANLTG